MDIRRLYIFVEGNDDERFFRRIILPELDNRYQSIKIIQYSQMPMKKRMAFIKSIDSMPEADYIKIRDIDYFPCVTALKQNIKKHIKCIEVSKIFVVIKEIESWYLAGISDEAIEKLKVRRRTERTDKVTKERFYTVIKNKIGAINIMMEILESFSIRKGVKRNRSFRYFVVKMGIDYNKDE